MYNPTLSPVRAVIRSLRCEQGQVLAQGLHKTDALTLEILRLASKTATSVALQAGAADIIVSDWVWAMRQRAAGEDFVFVPYSTALGAVMLADGNEAPAK